ncbi:molybdopterin-dependent oxidoreductase [Oceanithermus sp.]
MARWRVFALLLLVAVASAGCNPKKPTYTVIRKGGWSQPPPPVGKVLLTVILPDGRSYDLDRQGLQKLTWVRRVTRYHPREKDPPAAFEGVLLSDLIKAFGVREEGLYIRFTALDDYQLKRSWAELEPLEPILALKQNGKWLTIDDYGPVRVILPYDRLRPDPTEYNALWVWQLRVIEFLEQ